jgi:general L-amino acid transport system substrate-binding protein
MRLSRFVLFFMVLLCAPSALAETRLAEIKARGSVSCAAFPRPGLAMQHGSDTKGLYVELCHAITVAALGENAKQEFRVLEAPQDVEALRRGEIDVAFLSGSEFVNRALLDAVTPGPAVFYASYALLLEANSTAQTPDDLSGVPICFNQSRSEYQALEDRFAKKGLVFVRLGFEEDVELLDAYNSRHCRSALAEATELAAIRLRKGVNRFDSRILAEPLAVFPILAATPKGDAQWARIVAWTVHVLQAAEQKESAWLPGGAKALPLNGPDLGLDAAWRARVLAAVGDYGAIYERSLGDKSPYKLARGVNALWSAGGLIAPPIAE